MEHKLSIMGNFKSIIYRHKPSCRQLNTAYTGCNYIKLRKWYVNNTLKLIKI